MNHKHFTGVFDQEHVAKLEQWILCFLIVNTAAEQVDQRVRLKIKLKIN